MRFRVPLTTDRIDVSFPRVRQATIVTATGQVAALPVRLSQLSVPALVDLRGVTPDEQAKFIRTCGQGPALTVDGRVYQTSVSGTIGELSRYLPLRVHLCSLGGALRVGAGRHTLTTAPGTFAVTDLSLADQGPTTATAHGAARAVTIGSWQPDQSRLSIGPGPASYLEVHENYNPGWAATLNGHQLTPVRIDGWQQGFIVPAGLGGTITLSFPPTATYHLVLAVSLLAVAVLLALAAWSFTRGRRGTGRDGGSGPNGPDRWPPPAGTAGARRLRSACRRPARLAGRARRHRPGLRGRRSGGARRSRARLAGLAAARADGLPGVAALGRLRRHDRIGSAVRGTSDRHWPARFLRRPRASVRAHRAGRRADPRCYPPGLAPAHYDRRGG